MSDNKQPVDQYQKKAGRSKKQRKAYRVSTGIGGGIVGAAIGGLLGRKLGGVCGAFVGTVAGALVGKGTAERVNCTVEAVVDAAKSVADGVNHGVKDVGDVIKDTVDEVKPSVISAVNALKDTVEELQPSVVGAVKDVAENFNHSVKGVGDALKDTVDEVKPSVVGVVNALKDTVEELQPSVVGAVKGVAENFNLSVQDVADVLEDTVEEEQQPSVVSVGDVVKDTVKQPQPSVVSVGNVLKDTVKQPQPSVVGLAEEEQSFSEQMRKSSQEHPLSNDINEQDSESFKFLQQPNNLQEIQVQPIESKNLQQFKQERIKPWNENIQKFTVILLGAATITWIGVILGFSPKAKLLATKSPESPQTLSTKPKQLATKSLQAQPTLSTQTKQLATKSPQSSQALSPKPKTIADGWIFLGNINKNSASNLRGKSLIKNSQSIDSSVVPAVNSIATVTERSGVNLRKNRPQKPKLNYQNEKAIAILKPREKVKILKVETLATSHSTKPVSQVWAQVQRCGKVCK